jgi:hypothetical protein
MSYHCGIGPGMASIGVPPRDPHITCDTCGIPKWVPTDRYPPRWFRDMKAPPGWTLVRADGGRRVDTCPKCKEAKR